jgi:hypothetical protein
MEIIRRDQMMRAHLYMALAAVAAIYGIYAVATIDRRPDEQRIRSMVQSAAESIEKRDLSGVISCVSRNYEDEAGLNYDRLRVLAAQALRDEARFTASAEIRSLKVAGEKAVVELHAVIKGADGGEVYDRDVTLLLDKEPTRHMLVAPTKVWRVVSTRNLGIDYEM